MIQSGTFIGGLSKALALAAFRKEVRLLPHLYLYTLGRVREHKTARSDPALG